MAFRTQRKPPVTGVLTPRFWSSAIIRATLCAATAGALAATTTTLGSAAWLCGTRDVCGNALALSCVGLAPPVAGASPDDGHAR
jgi:hypothetical protein